MSCGDSCPYDPDDVFSDVVDLAEAGELTTNGSAVGPAAVATAAIMATYSPQLWDDLVAAPRRG